MYRKLSLISPLKSKRKHAKAAICHSLNSYGLVYVWVCMCVFQDPHVNQSLIICVIGFPMTLEMRTNSNCADLSVSK